MNNEITTTLPLGLKIAASYLIIGGLIGLLLPLLDAGSQYPEFEAKSAAYKAGTYLRMYMQEIAFLVCGIGLFMKKSWARKAAMVVLVFSTYYVSNEFAWGYTQGPPSAQITAMSYAIVIAWNSIWFYLIYRQSSVEALR